MTSYRVTCRRSGGWWAISVPDLKGVHTQARRLDQVAGMAREAIALMLDIAPEIIDVEIAPEMPSTVSQALEARQAARRAEQIANQTTAIAVRALLDDGYTVRDAGALLGLSPQRISQIAPAVPDETDQDSTSAARRAVAASQSSRKLSARITPLGP
ncbi:MAG: type II toxin-antitoxin system HicB family antitoxin [Dactylosporangium sp.]|nr:type II toxin-antitoxin system HicB family antitoxin [Dactylosporangium sp.]NNJ60969.1 type II toxin-antitoxin system HicB family antitoxin [Dactylosporangium sp.]